VSRASAHGPHAQKKSIVACERDRPDVVEKRKVYAQQISRIPLDRLKFVDESGSHIGMTRDRARAPSGERAVARIPRARGTVTSMIGAFSTKGFLALSTHKGATNGPIFRRFVVKKLLPTLRRGDVVVWDNACAHKPRDLREAIEAKGARLMFLPPYSPDLSPIEPGWGKLKTLLRAAEPRTVPRLRAAIRRAIRRITAKDAKGWFRYCGYQRE